MTGRWMTVLTLAVPAAVFGFLYGFVVQPQQAALAEARQRLSVLTAQLDGQRAAARTAAVDPDIDVAGLMATVLNGPAVGGVDNLVVETDQVAGGSDVSVAFDGRFEQIGGFFWNLRSLPSPLELRAVALTPGRGPLVHASVELVVLHRSGAQPPAPETTHPAADGMTVPEWPRNPFIAGRAEPARAVETRRAPVDPSGADSIVTGILVSNGRRVALVDGRIVSPGDRVRSGVVRAIEPEAVLIEGPGGRNRRIELARPVPHGERR